MSHDYRGWARGIQKALGWRYQRCFNFVSKNLETAASYAEVEKISIKDALVQLATAESEVKGELDD